MGGDRRGSAAYLVVPCQQAANAVRFVGVGGVEVEHEQEVPSLHDDYFLPLVLAAHVPARAQVGTHVRYSARVMRRAAHQKLQEVRCAGCSSSSTWALKAQLELLHESFGAVDELQ